MSSILSCSPGSAAATQRFTARLKTATRLCHTRAEQSGIVTEILHGRCRRASYVLWLRNLLVVYETLEHELAQRPEACLAAVSGGQVFRAAAIRHDLGKLAGGDWRVAVAILPETMLYAARIEAAAREDAVLLLAHAYVRYLGDLNGGRVIKKCLVQSFGLAEDEARFYEFGGMADLALFEARFRGDIDEAGRIEAAARQMIDEAVLAFEGNIAIASAVQADARPA